MSQAVCPKNTYISLFLGVLPKNVVYSLNATFIEYNVAVGDWFNPPEVGQIDLTGYSGQADGTIRARVTDDVRVTQVKIVIVSGEGLVVEQGDMRLEQGLWYSYTTRANCPAGPAKVMVTGLDLPGHAGRNEAMLAVG